MKDLSIVVHLCVHCVNFHVSQPVLNFDFFGVQDIRHLRTVRNPQSVCPLALVTKVVDMRTTSLNDANVIHVQYKSLILLVVDHSFLVVYVGVKGHVRSTQVWIQEKIGLHLRSLVQGDTHQPLSRAQ